MQSPNFRINPVNSVILIKRVLRYGTFVEPFVLFFRFVFLLTGFNALVSPIYR